MNIDEPIEKPLWLYQREPATKIALKRRRNSLNVMMGLHLSESLKHPLSYYRTLIRKNLNSLLVFSA